MDLKEIDILGKGISKHWYYRSKANAATRMLGNVRDATILDVGAGSGFFSRHLLKHTPAKTAWCVDISYASDTDDVETGKPIHFRREIGELHADVVLLMDVLEHVEDDVGLLRQYVEKVPSGARFLISVPAFQVLWSDHDVFLEHKRRYTVARIEHVASRAQLRVVRSSYYFGLVLPLAILARLKTSLVNSSKRPAHSQLTHHSPLTNALLFYACRAELPFFSHNRFGGLTAFCLATKP